jgi:hypothetical protein
MASPSDAASELHARAQKYAALTKDDLLIELQTLLEPALFKYSPDDDERRREGDTLWRNWRRRLAIMVCRNRTPEASARVNTLVVAGGGAAIEELGSQILGSGYLPHVTGAVAAALAALLYVELQQGIDQFCDAYYDADDFD